MVTRIRQSNLFDEIEEYRLERLKRITDRETPVPLAKGPKIILHVIPMNAFQRNIEIEISSVELGHDDLRPITAGGYGPIRFNFDGRLNAAYYSDTAQAYVQLFRNGIVESVTCHLLYERNGKGIISINAMEKELMKSVSHYLDIQKRFNVTAPCLAVLTLTGVLGYGLNAERVDLWDRREIDRNPLFFQPVEIIDFEVEPAKVLRRIFDQVWNAVGYPRCPNYDENGNYKQRR